MQRNHRRKRKKIDDCNRCQDNKTGHSKIQSRLNRFLHKWWQIAWQALAIQVLTYGFLLDFTNKNRRKKIDVTFEIWPEPKIPTVSPLTTNDTFIVNLGYSSRTISCAPLPPKYNGETRPRSHNFVHYFTIVFLWLLNIDERSFVSIRMRHWREENVLSLIKEFTKPKRFRQRKRNFLQNIRCMNFRISDSLSDFHKRMKQQPS